MTTFKSNITSIRRKGMHLITSNIGTKDNIKSLLIPKEEIKNILIVRPNHRLGNQLLMTPLVQEVLSTFPNASIDLFTGKVSPILFLNYKHIDRFICIPRKPFKELLKYSKTWLQLRKKKYDIVFNVDFSSSSGKLAIRFSKARIKFYGNQFNSSRTENPDYIHNAKYPVYYFREVMAQLGYENNNKEVPYLNLMLSKEELLHGKELLKNLIKDSTKPSITLYTYATGAKCYSEVWWNDFYQKLKEEFSDFNLIEVLPVENISMIGFKAPSFYSKDVREMASLMANTKAYVGADCGVMHLASASGIPTLAFFSVTNPNIYGPYNTGSKSLVTNNLNTRTILDELHRILEPETFSKSLLV
jgi:heptosyltransferase III